MKTMNRIIVSAMMLAVLTPGTAATNKSWTLEECMTYALENNIQVLQSRIQTNQKEIDLDNAKGNRLPSVSAGASQNWSFGRGLTADNTYDNTNTTSTSFSLGSDVTLFAGGRLNNNIKNAQLNLEASLEDLRRIQDDVRVQVAQAFIQIVYDRSLLNVARGQVSIDSMQVARLEALESTGKASPTEVASQKATLAQSQLTMIQAENNLKLSTLTLTQLLELESPEGFDILDPQISSLPDMIATNPEQIYQEACSSRPAVKAEELRLKRAQTDIDISKGAFYPTLSMNGGLGSNFYTSSKYQSKAFSNQIRDNFSQYIGLSLNIPVFNRFSNRNSLRSAKSSYNAQQLQLESTKKQLYKEIQQAYYNVLTSKNRYESSLAVENSARESFDLTTAKYEGGKSTVTEFNESKNRLVEASANVIKYRYEYIFNSALLDFYTSEEIKF